jgi:hypothetical protein
MVVVSHDMMSLLCPALKTERACCSNFFGLNLSLMMMQQPQWNPIKQCFCGVADHWGVDDERQKHVSSKMTFLQQDSSFVFAGFTLSLLIDKCSFVWFIAPWCHLPPIMDLP